MNPELLLAHFNRISGVPDAMPLMRRFLLDLAVRGKLVEQSPSDEPASELLRRFQEEKTQLVKDGVIKKIHSNPQPPDSAFPFPLPSGWAGSTLQSLCISVTDGDHLPPPKADQGIPFLVIGNVRSHTLDFAGCRHVSEEYYNALDTIRRPQMNDVLYTLVGSYGIPTMVTDDKKFCVQRHIGILRPSRKMNAPFLTRVLESKWVFDQATACATGIAQKTVPLAGLRKILIPLPPLAEQYRIVAKVDELLALLNELQLLTNEQEDRRDRVVLASVYHLSNAANAEVVRKQACFYFKHLPCLTTQPSHIQQLRQTILSLAVRGFLVPQDSEDEPASELLKQVSAEKARLAKECQIKQKPLPAIGESTVPFNLPCGWSWTRLGELSRLVTSGSRDWAKFYSNDGAIFVRMGNLSRDSYHLRLSNIQRVKPPADSEGARTKLEEGDILISITGEVGLLGLIPHNFDEAYINQHTCLVRPMDQLRSRFLPELFRSPFAQTQFDEPQRGLKNSFRLTDVTSFLVPLPPLAEQFRIVAKIDELMALCDRLEEQLVTSGVVSRVLLEAVLHHALTDTIESASRTDALTPESDVAPSRVHSLQQW